MCKCVNVEMGSYDRQVSMKDPFNARKRHDGWVCIDICLCEEIAELWHVGIETLESCCGHNITNGYIMVKNNSIAKMYELGYVNLHHQDCENFFIPKINKITYD